MIDGRTPIVADPPTVPVDGIVDLWQALTRIVAEEHLPAVSATVVPSEWVPLLKRVPIALSAVGTLALQVGVRASVPRALSAVGTLSLAVSVRTSVSRVFAAAGAVASAVTEKAPVPVGRSASGTLSATAVAGHPRAVAFSGSGQLSVDVRTRAKVAPTLAAETWLGHYYSPRTAAPLPASATGALSVDTALPKVPMGMNKVGTQQIVGDSNSSTPIFPRSTKVRGWAVRAGYPSTVVFDDGLRATAAMSVNFTGRVSFQSGGVAQFVQFMVVKNDVEVLATGSTGSTLTGTATLEPGDTLSLYAWGSSAVTNTYRNVVEANTYLYWAVS
ncbi:hypothetical protein [Prescottella equi]|uniref:hypothetical protein n=1 Tax=Rhodococcus hoagii TaxID=43767 RepID=UPI0007CD53FB|nr:hypothetical protein [Prescottella equi]